ncbi:hypothetical protein B0H14DRAFT_3450002 [Mycena olivaceomarginata]|nr:hypothetical protein B0H14DRAFT_3450002 [Mycena olivaceomarginata]
MHMRADVLQSYKAVFTGPSSAKDETKPVKKKVQNSSTCPPVCKILNMGGKVTGHSITYVAALAHMSLTDMSQISCNYYGFSYSQMYNFLVDYFETPPAKGYFSVNGGTYQFLFFSTFLEPTTHIIPRDVHIW